MSAFVYVNGQYHCLAGNKIVKDATLLDMKATDKIVLNGVAYNLGIGSAIPGVPVGPDVPECTITHINGTQPATGSVWYITPEGKGTMDGTSWANAASGSMVHAILLSATSGDRVYFSEGQYNNRYTITLPAGVSIYGGFTAQNPTWATRDAFEHPTVWTASYSGAWLNCASDSIQGQVVDGFTILNYVGTQQQTGNVTFRNGHVIGGMFRWTETIENSIFADTDVKTKYATGCYATGGTFCITRKAVICTVYNAAAHLTTAQACTAIKCVPDTSISPRIFYASGNTDCIAIECNTLAPPGSNQNYIYNVFDHMSVRCTAIKCSSSGSIFDVQSEQCTAIQCNVTYRPGYQTTPLLFARRATKGKAINCSATGSTASVFGADSEACIAINCICQSSSIFYSNSSSDYHRNGLAINCEAPTIFRGTSVYSCNACNCTTQYAFITGTAKNCISWNNSGADFHSITQLITCAGSVYDADLALTLGTDNTIARFTNTGFAPAQGVQDVGDCPSPIVDPEGYSEWLSAFGDWHPAADSFLLGAGTADSSVTTDVDGVTRPDPPSIGAYEAKPAQGTAE